jgi:molecular chaperone Hsp33
MALTSEAAGARRADDVVLPFQVEGLNIRGRLARLGPALDTILRQHAYPRPVSRLLAEALALAAALGSSLKYDGIFSVQAKGDGPIRLLVVDVNSAGHRRGYAQLTGRPIAADERRLSKLIGKGQLAFTVDQGPDTERYQGIVALSDDSLSAAVDHYFQQSEQLETRVVLAAGLGTAWRSAALMIQRLPGESPDPDAWNRTLHLVESLSEQELLDPELSPEDILYRLFHAERPRVFSSAALEARCRCSRERAIGALRLVPDEDLPDLLVDGRYVVTCQFCNTSHVFAEAEAKALRARAAGE